MTPIRHRPPVLLTGFDPFAGEAVNPSWEAVRSLDGSRIGGHRIVACQLPTSFGRAPRALRNALRELQPAGVVCVGQAGGRTHISLERVAINVCDARITDNDGAQPRNEPVASGGPDAYFTRLPLPACLASLHLAGIPAEISNTAGTYVCNQVMYALLHALRARRKVPAGFVHIPYLPSQAVAHRGAPSMSPDLVRSALRILVSVMLNPSKYPAPTPPSGREE